MEDAIKLCWFFYSAMVNENSMRMNQTPETQVMKMNADNAIPLTPNPNVPSRHDSIFGRPNVGQPFVVVSPSPSTDKGADSSGTIPREKAAIPVPTEEPPSSPPVKVTFAPLTATYRYTPVQAHSEGTNALDVTDLDVVFGRGGGTNRHRGNEIFRDLVAKARPGYLAARKYEKGGDRAPHCEGDPVARGEVAEEGHRHRSMAGGQRRRCVEENHAGFQGGSGISEAMGLVVEEHFRRRRASRVAGMNCPSS